MPFTPPAPSAAYIAPNGVTVVCPGIRVGHTFWINDIQYTKVGNKSLKKIADNSANWDQLQTVCTTGVTSMSSLFADFNSGGDKSFNVNIGSWDTSRVKYMQNLFYKATNFNQDIGGWDTSRVTTMYKMFFSTRGFNQDIGSWNTSSVTTMKYMFTKAKAFNQDIGGWDTGQVSNMENMFKQAKAFNQDLTGWQVGLMTIKSDCRRFCRFSGLKSANAPSLPKKCRKGCR